MPLSRGTKLGHYEINSPLGEGGMGEVYKGTDTRLKRTVAIKILPEHLSDEEHRNRFEHEARTISGLNHPHICTLHDIGREGRVHFMVMEYIEGETLADRLKRGPLPVEEALRYGRQIAEALGEAHREGVIHRDLKPGNVMLTKSGLKLVDFGLAKLKVSALGPTDSDFSAATEPKPLTREGTILGTFQYMAPEQLEGRDIDARTDIFALGAVLYEMVTGEKAFKGESPASLIAAILGGAPAPMTDLRPLLPPLLDDVVVSCLAKDPDERLQSARDVAKALRWASESSDATQAPPSAGKGRAPAWTIGAMLAVGLLAFTLGALRERDIDVRVAHFEVPPPEGMTFGRHLALSPDGRRLVFGAEAEGAGGRGMLFLRPLDSTVAQALPGTEGGVYPFWAPDSRSVAFFADGKLQTIDLDSGRVDTVCETREFYGGSWSEAGGILFSDSNRLYRVSPSGGEATPLTGTTPGEFVTWPLLLPDGRHFLTQKLLTEGAGLYAGSLDGGELTLVYPYRTIRDATAMAFDPSGYLLYIREGTLVAERFDAERLELTGDPIRLAERVWKLGAGYGSFSASHTGILAFEHAVGSRTTELTWLDRSGAVVGRVGEPGTYTELSLSPDGERLAVVDGEAASADIWLLDVARGTPTRFAGGDWPATSPEWSPDGSVIAFAGATATTGLSLQQKRTASTGDSERMFESAAAMQTYPSDWSSDARSIALYVQGSGTGSWELGILPAEGSEPRFFDLPFNELDMEFSPEGTHAAYVSDETGSYEVYIARLPELDDKRRVSTAGGFAPRWRRDGRELFYLTAERELMAAEVDVSSSASVRIGAPELLFVTNLVRLSTSRPPIFFRSQYDVTADGQRFLMALPVGPPPYRPIHVVLNWNAEKP